MKLLRATSNSPHFRELSRELEMELSIRDGDQHEFLAELNKVDHLPNAVVAYENELPVGCGAIRVFGTDSMEIKRMFVRPGNRGQKIATTILAELEKWARELGYPYCILETGKNQPEAIALYRKNNYTPIAKFGKYIGSENSLCFRKSI